MRKLDFLHYILWSLNCILIMSKLQKNVAPTMIEPESFDEPEEVLPEYKPEHPMLAYKPAMKSDKVDHLTNYVEVNPFEKREAAAKASK